MCIKLTPEKRRAKRVPFKFEGTSKGNYSIASFQGLNKNETFDRDTSGWPIEPFGTYKTFEFALQFDNVTFLPDKDIKGIEIKIE
jgi:uncharacterized protein (DUF2141 family)